MQLDCRVAPWQMDNYKRRELEALLAERSRRLGALGQGMVDDGG